MTTQDHLSIQDIKDNIVLLKDGGAAIVLHTSAVNFGLLSEREQVALVAAFAQLLNSLSFIIQIAITSERLNIESYLKLLENAQAKQTNPLLAQIMQDYRNFIGQTVKENEVLDKKFYVVIPVYAIEMGLGIGKQVDTKKALNLLTPRKDQLIRQFARVGLKLDQLTDRELIKLYHNLYNPQEVLPNIEVTPVNLQIAPQPTANTAPVVQSPIVSQQTPLNQSQPSKTHPFIVEELSDS